jgi:acyl-CoA synthetase (AMP-forming)/AMP-acid ligase II
VSAGRLLPQLFVDAAARHPEAPAVTHGGETVSYATLATAVAARAHELGQERVGRWGRALVLDDDLASIVELLAAMAVGDGILLGGREHEAAVVERARHWRAEITDEPSVVFATSGSSGAPKLVCHSHTTLAAALRNTLTLRNQQLGHQPPASQVLADELSTVISAGPHVPLTVVPGMPLWSISGFNLLELTVLTGGHLVLCDVTSPSELLDSIERARVTNIGVPPILLRGLVREQRRRARDVDTLVLVGIGSGPVDPAFARAAEDVFECAVITAYGSTEIGGAALMPRFDDPPAVRTGSVGRALPGVEIAVDSTGELQVRSDSVMRGYVDTEGRLEPHDRRSWYRTGDLVEIDDAGNAHILGRVDDQILRGGRLIDPVTIERALERHPDVQLAAVVGVPSHVPGEQDVWAACVCSGADPASAPADLVQLCRDALPPPSRPRRIVCVAEIPLRRDGSPHRPEIRDLLLRRSQEKK